MSATEKANKEAMNIKYLNSNIMKIGEIIWNYNNLISSQNQPIHIPYINSNKPFKNVKRIPPLSTSIRIPRLQPQRHATYPEDNQE